MGLFFGLEENPHPDEKKLKKWIFEYDNKNNDQNSFFLI